jgi:hypothetical protein
MSEAAGAAEAVMALFFSSSASRSACMSVEASSDCSGPPVLRSCKAYEYSGGNKEAATNLCELWINI